MSVCGTSHYRIDKIADILLVWYKLGVIDRPAWHIVLWSVYSFCLIMAAFYNWFISSLRFPSK